MEPVRWVHLASALLWPATAAVGLWWARSLERPRHRRWMYVVSAVTVVIGGENLLQALAPHHPRALPHLVANLVLAVTGAVVLAVLAVHGRGIVMEERVLRAVSGGRLAAGDPPRRAPVPLTPRETQVLTCLCLGQGTGEIADRLRISPHTATTHIRNILKKLDVGSRADAVVWALERGLLPEHGPLSLRSTTVYPQTGRSDTPAKVAKYPPKGMSRSFPTS